MSKINTHTPGPWRIDYGTFSVVADQPTGHDQDTSLSYYSGHLVCESVQWEANALIIAAAPDLLEALIDVMGRIERSGMSHKIGSTKAYAAIAKATGEPNGE